MKILFAFIFVATIAGNPSWAAQPPGEGGKEVSGVKGPAGNTGARAEKMSAARNRLEKKFSVDIDEDGVLFDEKQDPKAFLTRKDETPQGTQAQGYSRRRRKLVFLKPNGEVRKSIDIKTYEESVIKKGASFHSTTISRTKEDVAISQTGNLVAKLTDVYQGSELGLRIGGRGKAHLTIYDGDAIILCERDLPEDMFTGGLVVSRTGDTFALAFGRERTVSSDGQQKPSAEAWLEFYDRRCNKVGEYRKNGFDALINISVTEDNSVFIERLRRGGYEGEAIKANIAVDFNGNVLNEGIR